jgi:thioredoxin-like negative regulator of GroEL
MMFGEFASAPPHNTPATKAKRVSSSRGFSFLSSTVVLVVIAALSAMIPIMITASHVKQGIEIVLEHIESPEDRASLIKVAPRNETVEENYNQTTVVANRGRPTMLYFEADWCSYCRAERPVISQVQNYYTTIMDTWFIDVDDPANFDLVYDYDVPSLPHMILLDDQGHIVKRFYGYTELETLSRNIETSY